MNGIIMATLGQAFSILCWLLIVLKIGGTPLTGAIVGWVLPSLIAGISIVVYEVIYKSIRLPLAHVTISRELYRRLEDLETYTRAKSKTEIISEAIRLYEKALPPNNHQC